MQEFNTKDVWHDVLESIKVSVSPAIFSTWFSQTHLVELNDRGVRFSAAVGCASPFVKLTIESRYFGLVQDSLTKCLDKPCDLVFVVKEIPKKQNAEENTPLFGQQEENEKILKNALDKARVRSGFTFDNFAVSSSNQMAWAAADAVSKSPGSAYNPLFIWGGVGVGKTHLMLAVGHEILAKNPEMKVFACTGEDFTNDIVEGIRNKTTQEFRNKYRRLDALLIDDIQFLAGKDAVQEEFFHTFNTVTNAGGQIILTSDRPPQEISKLEERLRSRFEAGLIVDISPPDFELRCAILQIKAKNRGLTLSMDEVQLIAGNIDSARKLEGFLVKIVSEAKMKNSEISEELIQGLLGKGEAEILQTRRVSPDNLIGAVSRYFSLGKRVLLGDSRARPVARPRQILMYLLRRDLGLPLEEVGRLVGGRDHTTVMHAVEKITQMASVDVQIREDLMGIKQRL